MHESRTARIHAAAEAEGVMSARDAFAYSYVFVLCELGRLVQTDLNFPAFAAQGFSQVLLFHVAIFRRGQVTANGRSHIGHTVKVKQQCIRQALSEGYVKPEICRWFAHAQTYHTLFSAAQLYTWPRRTRTRQYSYSRTYLHYAKPVIFQKRSLAPS